MDKSDVNNLIQVNKDEFLKLISAKIVQDVINNSIKLIQQSNKPEQNDSKLDNKNYTQSNKFFGTKRWHCISRPQYKYSCGISSLVSCWNYLYSTLGYGRLNPLTQEEALTILGFSEPFDDIRFGPFTGNKTLMRWFYQLNNHFKVEGKASFFYKPVGSNKTLGINDNMAKNRLFNLLKSKNAAFIYHCHNHYICPIGYEREPLKKTNIYSSDDKLDSEQFVDWIFLADTSRKYQSLHCVKWQDIDLDLNCNTPQFFNIRQPEKGVQTKESIQTNSNNSKRVERNLHCIMKFESFVSNTESNFDVIINQLNQFKELDLPEDIQENDE